MCRRNLANRLLLNGVAVGDRLDARQVNTSGGRRRPDPMAEGKKRVRCKLRLQSTTLPLPRTSTDIVAKHLTQACTGTVLESLGIPQFDIVRVLPTEFARVMIRRHHLDMVFETRTRTIVDLEFQSTEERSLERFLSYATALYEKFQRPIRTVVLYTRHVDHAPDMLDMGGARYHVENVFLYQMDGDAVLNSVAEHLAQGTWSAADRIQLAFAYHMRFARHSTTEAFARIIECIEHLPEPEQTYVVAIFLGISGHQLSLEQQPELRRRLEMTDLLRTIEREAREASEKAFQQGLEQGLEQVAIKLLQKGTPVIEVVELTGLSPDVVTELRPQ
jgi:hypothetical protein